MINLSEIRQHRARVKEPQIISTKSDRKTPQITKPVFGIKPLTLLHKFPYLKLGRLKNYNSTDI